METFRPQMWCDGQVRPVRRLLVLCHRVPYPPDRGDRIRGYHLIRALSQHFDVAVAAASDQPIYSRQRAALEELTGGQALIHRIYAKPSRARGLAALLTGRAATPATFYRQRLAQQITQWHNRAPFDAVLTVCTGMLQYARLLTNPRYRSPRLKQPPGRHVLDLVDVDSIKWDTYARGARFPMRHIYGMESRRLRQIEVGRYDLFDAVTVVSEAELACYREVGGRHPNAVVVSNGVDLDYFEPREIGDDRTILFVGVLNYKPNVDGVLWFANQVLPRLRARVPRARLKIVGRDPCPAINALGRRKGVRLVGPAPDVRPHLHKAALVIAPLRIAPGVQNKVLEAMACGKAVVCTPEAARGIDARDGEHLLVAGGDNPGRFARQVYRVLTRLPYRKTIGDNARLRVERSYSWDATLAPMIGLIGGGALTRPLARAA